MSQSYYASTDPQTTPGTSGLLTYSNHNAINSPFIKSTGTFTYQAATGVSIVATSCANVQTLTASSAVNTVNLVASSCGSIPVFTSTNSITGVTIAGETLASTSATFGTVAATSATFGTVAATSATFGTVSATSATFGTVSATSATFGKISSSSALLPQISSTHQITLSGNFKHVESPTISTVVGTCAMPASDNVPNSGYSVLSSSSGDINRYFMQAPTSGARATVRFHCGLTTDNIAYLWFGATNSTAIWVGSATCGNLALKSCGFSPEVSLYAVNDTFWAIQSLSTYCENGGTISAVSSSCS